MLPPAPAGAAVTQPAGPGLLCLTGSLRPTVDVPGRFALLGPDGSRILVEGAGIDLTPFAGQSVTICGLPAPNGTLQALAAFSNLVAPLGTQGLVSLSQSAFGGFLPQGFARGTTVSAAILATL